MYSIRCIQSEKNKSGSIDVQCILIYLPKENIIDSKWNYI